jgi:hypothetical protein
VTLADLGITTPDDLTAEEEPAELEESPVADDGLRECALEGCTRRFTPFPPNRKFCDEHKNVTPKRAPTGRPPGRPPKVPKEPKAQKSPKIASGLPGPKPAGKATAAELEAVEARAKQLAMAAVAMLALVNQKADAVIVQRAAEPVAKATRDLAEYEPTIRALGKGGEMSGRAMAWVQFSTVVGASLVLPLLLAHNALPPKLRELLGSVEAMGLVVVEVPATDADETPSGKHAAA